MKIILIFYFFLFYLVVIKYLFIKSNKINRQKQKLINNYYNSKKNYFEFLPKKYSGLADNLVEIDNNLKIINIFNKNI
jgi:hypothetical protein